MTTYTTLSSGSLAVGKPLTSTIALALRDNPIAIAEGNSAAPVTAATWHPYNKVTNGDANTGLILDASLGAVQSVETPNFADGYEYQIRLVNILPSISTVFSVELYGATDAAYNASFITLGTTAIEVTAFVDVIWPRSAIHDHPFATHFNDYFGSVQSDVIYFTPAQKILKARVGVQSGDTMTDGKIYLYRRTAFAITL